jgi:hypothetical protein
VVSIFAREITDDLAGLVRKADEFVAKHKDEKAAAFLVLMTDDPDAAEEKLQELAKKTGSKIPLTIFDGKTGPKNYKISKDADVTVLMWRGKSVKANHAFKKGELNKEAIAKIVESTEKILD